MPTTSPKTLSTAQARDSFSEVLNRAVYGKERIVLTRRGKPLVAVVPIEDLELLEELEDSRDLEDFRAAKKEFEQSGEEGIPLDKVLAEFGIER